MIVEKKDGTIDFSDLNGEERENIASIRRVSRTKYRVDFTEEYKLEQIRKESEQRTKSVVEEIAKLVEEADFSKQGVGQELGQKMRELNSR